MFDQERFDNQHISQNITQHLETLNRLFEKGWEAKARDFAEFRRRGPRGATGGSSASRGPSAVRPKKGSGRTPGTAETPAHGHEDPFRPTADRSTPLPPLHLSNPGAALGAILEAVDKSRTSGYDLVVVIQALGRQISHYQGLFYSFISEMAGLDEIDSYSEAASELAAALHLTRAASESEYSLAVTVSQHPDLIDGLLSGAIDLRRAKVILDQIESLTPDQGAEVLSQVLPVASDLTTGQLRARLRRLVISLDPDGATRRFESGLLDRRLVVEANPDGTANLLVLNGPPSDVNAARARVEEMARALRGGDEARTLDQLRADVTLDILNGGTGAGEGRAVVDLVVDLPTLVGLAENPGEIPGYGPVAAEIARKIAIDQLDVPWEFTLTDQGRPVATGTLARRPTAAMKRHIRAKHPTCAHPGCRHPGRYADIDHRVERAEGGPTRLDNLTPLCRYHHRLKDLGWSYRREPDLSIVWTSPLGHTYVTTGQSP